MIRLLFVTPGNNALLVASGLERIPVEQGVEVVARHLLAMDLPDPSAVAERLVPALARADIVLFDLRDARDVVAALREDRALHPERTYIPLMGGSTDILTLCRMGTFNLDRLRAARGGSVNYARIQQITHFVDKLGGLLPVGALKHARCWVHVVRYWTAGGQGNIDNLLRLVLRTYGRGRGPRPGPPVERPVHRIEDPFSEEVFQDLTEWRASHPPDASLPTVGLLFYGGMHHEASVVGARALFEALRGRANVVPVATDGVQGLDAVRRFLLPARPDVLVSLLWFRLDGGPLGGDPAQTLDLLRAIDAPWIVPVTLYNRERTAWEVSDQGTSPVEAFATVVLPELDGATNPIPVLALERQGEAVRAAALPDRVERLASRILALARLRRTPRAERRLAVLVYDYPPGPGNAGNASYLDVRESLAGILRRLVDEGYDLGGDPPEDPLAALLDAGLCNGPSRTRAGERMSREAWQSFWRSLPEPRRREVEAAFGPAEDLEPAIPGRWFGRVFVGFQPARAFPTHDRSAPPHPGYLAFYAWLQQMDVHASLHLGTHGTVEFLPGKEMALSCTCFPDLLQGVVPQVYVYTVANPSEATLAKRRWHATLVDHHLPDFVPAGLYGEYRALLDGLERLREPGADAARLWPDLRERAKKLDLLFDDPDMLEDALRDQAVAAIPDGLHVFGRPKEGRGLARWLDGLARRPVAGWRVADLVQPHEDEAATIEDWTRTFVSTGRIPAELASRLGRERARTLQERWTSLGRAFLADGELPALVHALDGGFTLPGLMGDPLRSPEIYPTGRNGCAFDPTRIPHADAVARGGEIGRRLLEAHRERTGATPRTLGLVLWGFETARTGGETLGALLWLVGARLADAPGWLPAFEPIPLAELGRPRVDVHLAICGFFRDMFPNLIRDLDRLLRRIAALDEPSAVNPLRGEAPSSDPTRDPTLARIFGPAPGEYGTSLPDLVEASAWGDAAELGRSFERAMGHAYGERVHGARAQEVHRALLARTDGVSQVVDGEDYKLGDLDHYFEFFGGLARAVTVERGQPPVTLAVDSAGVEARVEDAAQALRRCSATRLENPRWIEAMLAHPLHGGKKIADRVTNLVGLAGTLDCVSPGSWDRVFARFVADDEMFGRLRENNPAAALSVARRMAEARQRGFWAASEAQWETLRRRLLDVEGVDEDEDPGESVG